MGYLKAGIQVMEPKSRSVRLQFNQLAAEAPAG